jgi:ubiquinone biosynthesis protein UbiJ
MKGFELILGIVGAIGTVGAILAWWLSKLLNDKKEMTIMVMDIKYMKEKIDDMKKDIDHLTVKIEYLNEKD